MDDFFVKSITSALFALVLAAPLAGALDIEYFSPAEKNKLVAEFEQAKLENAKALTGKTWNCSMYGVRTRLQVQRDVKLYALNSEPHEEKRLRNSGAQVISQYAVENSVLVGRTVKFEDQIRLTADGRLISRLSLRDPTPTVLAYSVCSPL